jgi:hypothetical protein
MAKKIKFMVVDTETATLPLADEIANNDPERKKRITIAMPLVYDIGWTICGRSGEIYEKKQFLIAETFSVPSVFNTAYYAEKRPIYLEMLQKGETQVLPWDNVMEIFIKDLEKVDSVGAFNSMFDFKKALPYTELYIRKLYSATYYQWEDFQRKRAIRIANGEKSDPNPEFEPDVFRFRNKAYPLFDIWGLATTHLLNNATYKKKCLEYGLLTNSGTFFKTSAESSYKYLCDKYDFIESHTALDDAEIETFILSKIAQRHAVTIGIKYFPFRDLGYTDTFCMRRKRPDLSECNVVLEAIAAYIDKKNEEGNDSNYLRGLENRLDKLLKYMNGEGV